MAGRTTSRRSATSSTPARRARSDVKQRIHRGVARTPRSGSCTARARAAPRGCRRPSGSSARARSGCRGRGWSCASSTPATASRVPRARTASCGSTPPQGRFEYHNDPDEDRAAPGGTARSRVGDIGHLDDDGYLYLTDRLSDMLIRAGVNMYPREIEDVLHGHPDVVDCAVFGIPHDRDGEHPMAVVEVRGATDGRRAADVVRGAARPVQGAHRHRADRRAAPRPQRQGAQAPPPRPRPGPAPADAI